MTGWIHKTELDMTWQEAHGLTYTMIPKPSEGLRTIQLLLSICKIWAAHSSWADASSLLGCHAASHPRRLDSSTTKSLYRFWMWWVKNAYTYATSNVPVFNSHSFLANSHDANLMHYRAAHCSFNSCYILCHHRWHTLRNGNLQQCKGSKTIW